MKPVRFNSEKSSVNNVFFSFFKCFKYILSWLGEIICKIQNRFLSIKFKAHQPYDRISATSYLAFGRSCFGKNYTRKIRVFFNELEQVLVYFVLASLLLQDDYLALYVNFRQEFPRMVILSFDVIGSGYKFPLSNNSLLHNYFCRLYLPFIIILACTIIRYPKVSNLERSVPPPPLFLKVRELILPKIPRKGGGWKNC